jgi:hypothetical protein
MPGLGRIARDGVMIATLGFVCMRELRELREARGPLGLPIERDLHFEAAKTLSAYADEARAHGRIVTSSSCQAVRASLPSPGDASQRRDFDSPSGLAGKIARESVATSV